MAATRFNGPFGCALPAGVDPAIRERMEMAPAEVMAEEGVRKQIDDLGIEPVWCNGKDYAALLRSIENGAGANPEGNRHGQEAAMSRPAEARRHDLMARA